MVPFLPIFFWSSCSIRRSWFMFWLTSTISSANRKLFKNLPSILIHFSSHSCFEDIFQSNGEQLYDISQPNSPFRWDFVRFGIFRDVYYRRCIFIYSAATLEVNTPMKLKFFWDIVLKFGMQNTNDWAPVHQKDSIFCWIHLFRSGKGRQPPTLWGETSSHTQRGRTISL